MKPYSVMLIAGEASGDVHAAGLVAGLRRRLVKQGAALNRDPQPQTASLEPRFFGAGGERMRAAGVELVMDLTSHAVFGLVEVVRHLGKFRRLGRQLLSVAGERQPDVIVLVDYGGFNRAFAAAIRRRLRRGGVFANWRPRIVYFVSPQVWASREGRARQLERDVDLLLSIIPFEPAWYAEHAPRLPVEFVGHPVAEIGAERKAAPDNVPVVLLLPGSRTQEIRRHLPVMADAVRRMRRERPIRPWMVLANESLLQLATRITPVRLAELGAEDPAASSGSKAICCRVGRLHDLLRQADVAIASSGSVTVECAAFRVPTVVIYRVAWVTYWIARQLIRVPYVAMPNLLAEARVYPELLQADATPERIAAEALDLLGNQRRRGEVAEQLDRVVALLGAPGAYGRAAEAVVRLLGGRQNEE